MRKLSKPNTRNVTLAPFEPSRRLRDEYTQELVKLVTQMNNEVINAVLEVYLSKRDATGIARDSNPIEQIALIIKRIRDKWAYIIDKKSRKLAQWLAEASNQDADNTLNRLLKRAGDIERFFPKSKPIESILSAVIETNVSYIKNLQAKSYTDIEFLVYDTIMNGRTKKDLYEGLQKHKGVTKRRAKYIANDQVRKATQTLGDQKAMDLGVEEAVWWHSGAGKEPRKSHQKAGVDRLVFNIKKGAYIDGEYIKPGQLPGCKCGQRYILPVPRRRNAQQGISNR